MRDVPDTGDGVTPRADDPTSFPEAIRPILGRWPLVNRHGKRVLWRVVMTRAAWDALPDEVRYEAVPSEDGSLVSCDVPDTGPGVVLCSAWTPDRPGPPDPS